MSLKRAILNKIYAFVCIISPKLNNRFIYALQSRKKLDLKNPKTFNDKLVWLKFNCYENNSTVIQCSDKYAVREYIKKIGCGEILNDLIGVYHSVSEIEWDELPNKFVLKWNFGSGYNIICDNKDYLDIKDTIRKLKKWGGSKYWLYFGEMQYKKIDKYIVCERYLETNQGRLPNDYKFYCFNEEPVAILVLKDRDKDIKAVFMDLEWNVIDYPDIAEKMDINPKRPESLDQMIKYAKILCKGFPFVRIDFYDNNGKVVFGEITYTTGAGLFVPQIEIDGKNMGELINLSMIPE